MKGLTVALRRGFETLSLDAAMICMTSLSFIDLRHLSVVSKTSRDFVKAYVASRYRRLLAHFYLGPSFRKRVLGDERAILGGMAVTRLAMNSTDFGPDARIYVEETTFDSLDRELSLAGYVRVSELSTSFDVLILHPTTARIIFVKGTGFDWRVLEVFIIRKYYIPEASLVTTATLATMVYATDDSITVFFPSSFARDQTFVRRIPSAIKWSELNAGVSALDLPPPVQMEVDIVRLRGFDVAYGFDTAGGRPCLSWECPIRAFKELRPLFATVEFGSRESPDTVWMVRSALARQTQLLQYGSCNRIDCVITDDDEE